jgi:hypothetical protein
MKNSGLHFFSCFSGDTRMQEENQRRTLINKERMSEDGNIFRRDFNRVVKTGLRRDTRKPFRDHETEHFLQTLNVITICSRLRLSRRGFISRREGSSSKKKKKRNKRTHEFRTWSS